MNQSPISSIVYHILIVEMVLNKPFEYVQKVWPLVKDLKVGALDDELKRIDNLYKFCDTHVYHRTFSASKNIDVWPDMPCQNFGAIRQLKNHGIRKEVALLISSEKRFEL